MMRQEWGTHISTHEQKNTLSMNVMHQNWSLDQGGVEREEVKYRENPRRLT